MKLTISILLLFFYALMYSQEARFTVKDDLPAVVLKNRYGYTQMAIAKGKGDFHPKAEKGTLILRNLTSHNIILSMPNTSNDGSRSIRITDGYNLNTFVVRNNGKVGIGTEVFDTSDYKLYVKKGIKTEKVKVEIASENNWADYVFDKDYNLMPLNEIERFIDKYNHLPEVPSAKEVVANGLELKEMNVLLLKKIEELTLHIIKLNKRIETLEKEKGE